MRSGFEFCSARSPRIAGDIVFGLLACVIAGLGAWPELASSQAFHPAHDPLWRGMWAQLLHLNARHLGLNLAGLLAVWGLAHYQHQQMQAGLALVLSAFTVCLGLTWSNTPPAWYVGLSGALYGACLFVALHMLMQYKAPGQRVICAGVALGIVCKAAWGISATQWIGAPVVPVAHLYGCAGGLCVAASQYLFKHYRLCLPRLR